LEELIYNLDLDRKAKEKGDLSESNLKEFLSKNPHM